MKRKLLLTKTLLIAFGLFMGSNVWATTVTKIYDFSGNVVNNSLAKGKAISLTLTGDNIGTADESNVKLISGPASGTAFDFDGHFAAESTNIEFRNGNSGNNNYKTCKGIQYHSTTGTNHFSILNLKKADKVTITTGYGTTRFASTNAKVGNDQIELNQRVGSDANTGDTGSETVCTMTSDGNLDLILEAWATIMSIKIEYTDTYEVESTSDVSDGAVVESVRGITMTYRGSWTVGTNTYAGSGSTANASSSNAGTTVVPTTGDYLEFTPTVTGELTVKAAFYRSNGWRIVKENGQTTGSFRDGSNNNTQEHSFGILLAGHTYYLYKYEGTYAYSFKYFRFTPCENTSYSVYETDVIKGGTEITEVAGITMTYGGTTDENWYYVSGRGPGVNAGAHATLTNGIPTAGTFVKFEPSVNGVLTLRWYGYAARTAMQRQC